MRSRSGEASVITLSSAGHSTSINKSTTTCIAAMSVPRAHVSCRSTAMTARQRTGFLFDANTAVERATKPLFVETCSPIAIRGVIKKSVT